MANPATPYGLPIEVARILGCVGSGGGVAWLNYLTFEALQSTNSTANANGDNTDTDGFNGAVLGTMIAFALLMLGGLLWLYVGYTQGVWDGRNWRPHVGGMDSVLLVLYGTGTCVSEGMNMYRYNSYVGAAHKQLWIGQGVVSIICHLTQIVTVLAVNVINFHYPLKSKNNRKWSVVHEQTFKTIRYGFGLLSWFNLCFFALDAMGQTVREDDYNGFSGGVFAFIYPCIINFRITLFKFWFLKCIWPQNIHLNVDDTPSAQAPPNVVAADLQARPWPTQPMAPLVNPTEDTEENGGEDGNGNAAPGGEDGNGNAAPAGDDGRNFAPGRDPLLRHDALVVGGNGNAPPGRDPPGD